jgi:hypothetical protein
VNILLWILQILLAIHTATGAVWKVFNTEQAVPSLNAIPHGMWLALSVIEIACVFGLVVPAFHRPLAMLVPLAAIVIAAEMLIFCMLHLASGASDFGPMIYWLIVAAICGFIAYGRFALSPL